MSWKPLPPRNSRAHSTWRGRRWSATRLSRLSAGESRLIQTMHHIIADGWSYPVIFGDIVAHYNASVGVGTGLAPVPSPCATTSKPSPAETTNPPDARGPRRLPASTPPGCFPTGEHTVGEHRSIVRRLSAELTACPHAGSPRSWSHPQHRAARRVGPAPGPAARPHRVVFGSTVSGRGGELADTESIVGLLINTIPLPMSWEPTTSIAAAVAELQDRQSRRCWTPNSSDWPNWPGSPVSGSLFDTMVVVENFPSEATEPPAACKSPAVQRLHRHRLAALPGILRRLPRRPADRGDQVRRRRGE